MTAPSSDLLDALDAAIRGAPAAGAPAWIGELLAARGGPALGLGLDGLPAAWRAALSRAGVPLCPGPGTLRWGVDLAEAPVEHPRADGDRLLLPPSAAFARLGSLALRPLRERVAAATGLRLKLGVGVHLRCWADAAALVSAADIPLGGFLIGPRPGSRTNLMVAPGGHQIVQW